MRSDFEGSKPDALKVAATRCRRATLLALIAALVAAPSAFAQLSSGDQLPEALRQVKPSSGVCRADESQTVDRKGGVVPDVLPDMGCAITVVEARSMRARPNGMIADLRSASQYEQFHIEGALPLTLSALSSKPYWREKELMLLGDGKGERELYSACARLKHAGYRHVHVLRGGMPQWLEAGSQTVGNSPSAQQLSRLSASEFWLESQNLDNLVVLDKEQYALQGELTSSVRLNEQSADAIKSVLERRRKELKNPPLNAVVLAAQPSVTDDQVQRLQAALRPVPLLVYAGSREDVSRHVATQKAIWLAQAHGPKQLACGR